MFSLQLSFPFSVSSAVLGLKPYEVSCFNQGVSYFCRIELLPNSVTHGALVIDRCDLTNYGIGMWASFSDSLVKHSMSCFSDYVDYTRYMKFSESVSDSFRSVIFRSDVLD